MAASKVDCQTSHYDPLPPESDHQQEEQNYIVLPLYSPAVLCRQYRFRLICTGILLLVALAAYSLWPSVPDLKIARLRLDRIEIHTAPQIAIDITLALIVQVINRDLYSLDYHSLYVAIGYRGKQLGFVRSDHGLVRARGSSYVDAKLEFDGVEVLSDIMFLLEDLARGSVPFDTVTEVCGQLGLFFFEFPLKAKVSCVVYVNTSNQTVVRQNCYQEVRHRLSVAFIVSRVDLIFNS
ncbi:hypothetical protein F0562_024658 [Nyssa sinensis]|uniref:Late embryogenesis abundant protein LEA-2 subgroup domain-containing protein n=1 Tax=Nyssa sinensis TaxID=561372 RepID=A0A5J5BBC4_9ASTE|nr:hypothetical protein F0562_024658 [Nyssa sinensis]